jgi:outer membrane protein OmpA-like peptidoglycan-associated protein
MGDAIVTKSRLSYLGLSALGLVCAACGAAAPSAELLTARNAYAEARNGEAAQLNPKGVHEAYKALQDAEKVHEEDGGSKRERNYAYVATRKSELAIAQASEVLARKEQTRAEETYKAGLERQAQQVAEQSEKYAQQLTHTQQELQQNAQALEERERKLQAAEAAAEQAKQQLQKMESLREEQGRLIISMSGVLFEPGGDELSDLAKRRLDTVANALGAYVDREIVVEGHTDAQGRDQANQALSQKRADRVREYLESHGVPPQQIRSVGRGESNPVASNDSAEGRASNRRVEIIVEPADKPRVGSREALPPGEAVPSEARTGELDRPNTQNGAGATPSPGTERREPAAPPSSRPLPRPAQ